MYGPLSKAPHLGPYNPNPLVSLLVAPASKSLQNSPEIPLDTFDT